MSRLEPATGRESLAVPAISAEDDTRSTQSARSVDTGARSFKLGRWRRVVGLGLLGTTIFLWTASNFLASTIFADNTYSKPYLVTYINTSFFILPLIPILLNKAYRNPDELRRWKEEIQTRLSRQYAPLKQEETESTSFNDSPEMNGRSRSVSSFPQVLLGDAMERSQELSAKTIEMDTTPLTLAETATLSLEFCMLWFLANYFVAACLQYTTVASSTILTSTSSVFTLLFGSLFKVEKFTLRKLIGVLASLTGIILISSIDLSGRNQDDEHRGDFPEKSSKEIAIGDFMAFLSAVFYGLYAVFMKKRIPDETRIDMPVFFGLVGLINVCILWPGLILLHVTGIETFQLPPSGRVLAVILGNSISSLIGDMTWAYAVLLTSPIVVSVGLSMTIPFSLIGQIVLNDQTAGPWYWLGACIVVLSFVFVNQEDKQEVEAPPSLRADDGSLLERQGSVT